MLSNKYYFIADTHFFHQRIIEYENRPFENTNEMNEILIKNWNRVVRNGHIVFVLGDFAFCGKEPMREICKQLNGNKHLIMGNHDEKSANFYRSIGFDEVSKYPIIFQENWILSHQPMPLSPDSFFKNIYGHVHAKPEFQDFNFQSCCVSVERINYTPIEFGDIQKKMQLYRPDEDEQLFETEINVSDQAINSVARRIISKHKVAFKELAK
ncbi:phosphoesterase [Acetobacterium fimetarium]|uniref:Phosphoesterase n=1 Tax=Acetobacterium fimetarium TaxID=52691 RepID=A0ABR6WU15_9FIRM|nr:metallophosphoesterase [Acetobacterium fimetarium]MBC3804045.1 phosphoesterase [Acetobacterium fimetarium]